MAEARTHRCGSSGREISSTMEEASVVGFSKMRKETDPIKVIADRARQVVLDATDRGWAGAPFDPLKLADLSRLRIMPRADNMGCQAIPWKVDSSGSNSIPTVRTAGCDTRSPTKIAPHPYCERCSAEYVFRSRHQDLTRDEWGLRHCATSALQKS